ncbi:GPI-anchored mannoprotein [Saccharomyces paradoxus]|uniref:GPI-anchored mannoprotein n=1 Tax=Saccharomyces paradoxus TaxID=27291 RepID=A0A8B8UPY2_SACPA|nr:Tir1 [Saccharomyces paradoxus]QHS72792.1 Tir1 [Saccharomyces paradoxus]
MAYTKIALFAAIAALASAQTQDQINELNVILNDVKSNIQQYISLATDPNSGFSLSNMPAGVLDIGMALASATDDSYTSMYSEVDFAGVSKMLTQVPWYSSRLEPALKSLEGASSAAPSSSEAKTSSAAPSSSEAKTSSAAPSSSEAKTSSAAPSSSEAKTSSAAPSSSEAKTSSAAPSSSEAKTSSVNSGSAKTASATPESSAAASSAKASAISQITDGQIQATKTVSQQTENGAAKAFVGMGAGVVAAAAMLL